MRGDDPFDPFERVGDFLKAHPAPTVVLGLIRINQRVFFAGKVLIEIAQRHARLLADIFDADFVERAGFAQIHHNLLEFFAGSLRLKLAGRLFLFHAVFLSVPCLFVFPSIIHESAENENKHLEFVK